MTHLYLLNYEERDGFYVGHVAAKAYFFRAKSLFWLPAENTSVKYKGLIENDLLTNIEL